jgi:hypothetical protein
LIIGDYVQQSTKVVNTEIKGSNLYVHLEKIIYTDSVDDWSIKENRTMIYLKEQNIKIREGPVMSKHIKFYLNRGRSRSGKDNHSYIHSFV